MISDPELSLSEAKLMLKVDEYHSSISIDLPLKHSHFMPYGTKLNFNFYNANYDLFNEGLLSINWIDIISVYNVNLMLDISYSKLIRF